MHIYTTHIKKDKGIEKYSRKKKQKQRETQTKEKKTEGSKYVRTE